MKRRSPFPALLSIVCLLSGCGRPSVQAEPYLQDLERALTLRDEISRCYLEALEEARAYTADPSDESLRKAKEVCLHSIEAITDMETVESELTDEQRRSMAELGMDQADYMTPFLLQSYEKGTRLQTLTDVLRYLNQAPVNNDALTLTSESNISFEKLGWQIDLIGVNHLLAEVPEDQVEDFKNDFLSNLFVFRGTDIQWETDRTVLEERSETVFGQMEDVIGRHAEGVGEIYASVLEEAKRVGPELEAAGLPADEAERLGRRVDRLMEEAQSASE